ncbi:4'-phosphopantetheinyl transferase family protein [Desulfuromonas thiophila]|uniref:4'-phosphopantetheinyl transferase n=1 Tax=Desulfuromonas thiophila TaxID=57664 RepID=A0A1G7E2N3_9BACT|nr:4'-phosphopantetheinyl transferase superfamily protein [Desulfuromonas thiophila]SDE57746.1 4'-phosphopantetheinyl transferase [Desulfuromonas thiophila]
MAIPQVQIFTARFDDAWPAEMLERALALLGPADQAQIRRFRRWQDRQLRLVGRLLLRQALPAYGLAAEALWRLQREAGGRPFITGAPAFSIAHAGSRAVCAVGDGVTPGIDLEPLRPLAPADLALALAEVERRRLAAQANPAVELLRLWTQKESALKACGRGLSLDLRLVCPQAGRVAVAGVWYELQTVVVDPAYCCCLATAGPATVRLTEVPLAILLPPALL